MNQCETAERILDAAEMLFARNGYHNTSMRAITTEAQANVAAVNYHFGSKERLLEAVFKRRLVPLNELRSAALDRVAQQAVQQGRPPAVEAVLRAFVEPTVRFCCSEPGGNHFSALVGRSMSDADATGRTIFMQYIQPLFRQLSELLAQALPELDRAVLLLRLQFAIGATSHIMRLLGQPEGTMRQLLGELEVETIMEELMTFVTAGTEA